MSFNGSGTFVINSTGQPVVTGTVISASTFNSLTADLGTGLSTTVTKDGQTTTTAKIPFALGLSAAAASNFAAGTVGLPAIYLSTDTTTGLYRIGANNDGFAVSGAKVLDIASTGLGITGTLKLAGATSGTTTVIATDAVTATITLPSATATLATLGANTFVGNQAITGALSVSTTLAVTGAATLSSTLSATSFSPTGATVPANGVYLPAAKTVGISTNSVHCLDIGENGSATLYLGAGSTGAWQWMLNDLATNDMSFLAWTGAAFTRRLNLTNAGGLTITNATFNQFVNSNNASGTETIRSYLGTSANDTSSYHFVAKLTGGSDRLYIFGNGNVVNANNSYGALSDRKLKTNIEPSGSQLKDVLALSKIVSKFNFISEPDGARQIGWVAQEVQKVSPGLVTASNDYKEVIVKDADGVETTEKLATGTQTLAVQHSIAQMKLFKAFGEFYDEMQSRLAALEAK